MRRYKIVACILLIFSVFGFVLAAPVAIQEVREACADAVDGDDNAIVGSRKRADDEEPLLRRPLPEQELSTSNWWSTPSRDHWQGSSSAPKYASGTLLKPSFSSGERKPPLLSTSGGNELSESSRNPLAGGKAESIQPAGTLTEIQPTSSSTRKAKSVSWATSENVKLPSGAIASETLPPRPLEIKTLPQPASSAPLPEAKMAAQQSRPPPKPQSKKMFKKLVGKLKFKFWRRIS